MASRPPQGSDTPPETPKPANENLGEEERFQQGVLHFVYLSAPFKKFLTDIAPEGDVPDFSQELCRTAFENYASFVPGESLGAWLEAHARNIVLAEALVPFQLNGESSASPEQIEQYRELLQSAKEDFTKLPKLQSDALILHAFYDLNARKVARVLSRMGSTKIFTVAEVEELLTSARAFLNAKRIERENKDSSE